MICDNILDTVGRTPLVRLGRLNMGNGSEVLVKLEGANPGGSVKDRAALSMITAAERSGQLKPGGTIIESTSGNLGKALAFIGAAKGYRVILVTDPKAAGSMLDFVAAFGTEVHVVRTPDELGYQRPRLAKVAELLEQNPGAFWPDQYNNPGNPGIHAEQTAYELLDEVPAFDALVCAVGTGGHISGLAATLKHKLPDIAIVGSDVVGSAAFGFPYKGWEMRGLGIAWTPGNLHQHLVDLVHPITDPEGFATTRLLARQEGLLVGESTGAAVFSALAYAHAHPGSTVVAVSPDSGANYLGESFDDIWLTERGVLQNIEAQGLDSLDGLLAGARSPRNDFIQLDRVQPQLV
ncbi:PLP-dependent cysteine synthase family protein [Actinokineospora sp. HUAS TT18]|uniref:PLP-dependent cysteine synthase family protein n=1 Tax=Actinokineospora sp. HUAS TT18 TaxID=3447451 RepID=UPI003F521105